MRGSSVPHNDLDRIENILRLGNRKFSTEFTEWKRENFQRVFDWDVATTGRKDQSHTRSIRFFKEALGRQDTCVTFSHRNYVWHRPTEGWTLYADRRGPALHVPRCATPVEAYNAFHRFRDRLDAYFAALPA